MLRGVYFRNFKCFQSFEEHPIALKITSSLIKYDFSPLCFKEKKWIYVINFHMETPKELNYIKYNRVIDIRDEKKMYQPILWSLMRTDFNIVCDLVSFLVYSLTGIFRMLINCFYKSIYSGPCVAKWDRCYQKVE